MGNWASAGVDVYKTHSGTLSWVRGVAHTAGTLETRGVSRWLGAASDPILKDAWEGFKVQS